MDNFKFIKSNKNSNLIVYNNFIYRKKLTRDSVEYWYCIRDSCKVGIKLQNGVINSGRQTLHNHQEESRELLKRDQRSIIMKVATDDHVKTGRQIYDKSTSLFLTNNSNNPDLELGNALLSYENVKMTIHKYKNSKLPKLPKTLSDINIPDDLKITKKSTILIGIRWK